MGITSIAPPSNSGLFLSITLAWGNHKKHLKAMVDSGAARNFMDFSLALKVPTDSLVTPLTVTALNGRPLRPGDVTLLTSLLHLSIQKHQEELCFHLIRSPVFPVILGHPWFLQHNPHLNWSTGAILSWGPTCHVTRLIQSSSDSTLESQEPLDLSQVPTQYHHLKAVFTKKKPCLYPLTVHLTAPLTSFQVPVPPEVASFLFLLPSVQQWTTTLRKSLQQGLFALLALVSSLLVKRMGPSSLHRLSRPQQDQYMEPLPLAAYGHCL